MLVELTHQCGLFTTVCFPLGYSYILWTFSMFYYCFCTLTQHMGLYCFLASLRAVPNLTLLKFQMADRYLRSFLKRTSFFPFTWESHFCHNILQAVLKESCVTENKKTFEKKMISCASEVYTT